MADVEENKDIPTEKKDLSQDVVDLSYINDTEVCTSIRLIIEEAILTAPDSTFFCLLQISLPEITCSTVFKFFSELWAYFRCNNEKCLQKYGQPSPDVMERASKALLRDYNSFENVFSRFIARDTDGTKPHYLFFMMESGDTFFIRRNFASDPASEKLCHFFVVNPKVTENIPTTKPYINLTKIREANTAEGTLPLNGGQLIAVFLHNKFIKREEIDERPLRYFKWDSNNNLVRKTKEDYLTTE